MIKLPQLTESRDSGLLVPELQDGVERLKELCKARGLVLGVGTTVRGPEAQARMWCRSRTPEEVASRHDIILQAAPTIAGLLSAELAGFGPQVTCHMPMQSFHQLGEAVDLYADVGGKAIWEGSTARLIAEICKEVGLAHSWSEKSWEPKSRHWHVQLSRKETPFMVRGLFDSWRDAEWAMLERFEVQP